MAWKKKKQEDGFDVLDEIKEPFTFAGFYEDHIVGRVKKCRKFLEEKGILFFLLSPFQQRNRLILQLAVIVLGVLLGVVPRSMSLVEQAKERNAASEMAQLIEDGAVYTSGSIHVRPLASSQYRRQHILAFLITGSGTAAPSTPERYKVELAAARGVLDPENVACSYNVFPVSEEERVLLVHTDHTAQEDTTGIFNLYVELASDKLEQSRRQPIEVVLSDSQETNSLFGASGISLAPLTEGILDSGATPIKDAEGSLADALLAYELEVERIASLPLDMAAAPTLSELTEYVDDNRAYASLTDQSTTKDIEGLDEDGDVSPDRYGAAIDMDGTRYDEKKIKAITEGKKARPLTEEEEAAVKELDSLQSKADAVISALSARNSAAGAMYSRLHAYKLLLNQEVGLASFVPAVTPGKAPDAAPGDGASDRAEPMEETSESTPENQPGTAPEGG